MEQAHDIVVPAGFVLEGDLAVAYHILEHTHDSLFLTGRAGTGKSSLLNYFRRHTRKRHVVLAPTGLAAIQVGGSTIHSFFGFPLRPLLREDPDIRVWGKGHPRLRLLQKMETLIIDEVSMVRADLLDAIDFSLRLNMGVDVPFGGKQVILIGDVFQLPPVVTDRERDLPMHDEYESPYFFSAHAFRQLSPTLLALKKIYRQTDEDFIYLLNRVRQGVATAYDLDALNERVGASLPDDAFAITLTSVNAAADLTNLQQLRALQTPSQTYKGVTEGSFPERLFPVQQTLTLKAGAQVMMVKNDLQGRWVNGSLGVAEVVTPEEIYVRFENGKMYPVEKVMWEHKTYRWDAGSKSISFEIHGTYTHYPVRLAWAITIHKSQGLTFDRVIIDLGRGAFAHGQLYVALSRCKTLSGISLRSRLQARDVIVDEAVERFASRFRSLS